MADHRLPKFGCYHPPSAAAFVVCGWPVLQLWSQPIARPLLLHRAGLDENLLLHHHLHHLHNLHNLQTSTTFNLQPSTSTPPPSSLLPPPFSLLTNQTSPLRCSKPACHQAQSLPVNKYPYSTSARAPRTADQLHISNSRKPASCTEENRLVAQTNKHRCRIHTLGTKYISPAEEAPFATQDLNRPWEPRGAALLPILRPPSHPSSPSSPIPIPIPGSKRTPTATIPAPHSLAAILSPSAPPEDSSSRHSRASSPKRTHTEAFSPSDQPYLHPTSPIQHRPGLAPFEGPGSGTRAADEGSKLAMRGGLEEKKPQKMVRSSIACSRCRRSKVKCVNSGTNSTCKACAQSNRECTYPTAGSSAATPRRPEPSPSIKLEHDGESKKRVRKVEDSNRRNSSRAGDDPLDSPILTKKVWVELYDLFKLHFSTEMPFLHPPRFRKKMYKAAFPRDPATSPAELQDSKILLLGVLTLTARFHPDLVAYHSSTDDKLAASDYYATALAAAFGPIGGNMTKPSLEGIQGLLMLGLYEWGQTKGLSAWVYLGIAIRLAQSMGLEYEDDPDIKFHKSSPHGPASSDRSAADIATDKEIRRRTLWSCFIMDRALSAGKFRPSMMNPDRFRVRLPQTENNFLFENHVEIGFLKPNFLGSQAVHQEASLHDNGVLSRYVCLVEIFGRFSEYSYAGGRRTEKLLTPWDPGSEFFKLRRQLEEFYHSLPSNLTFTEANLSAHIEQRNATPYASLHTLYSLCLIMLHREYIPFIPLRCNGPEGPLDEPTFPKEKYDVPDGFWVESAEIIFKASRDILDIVSTCQDSNALPESPQLGFAVYQAAFVAVYAGYFPHMDQKGHIRPADTRTDFRQSGYTPLAEKLLQDLVPKLRMVKSYLTQIQNMHRYFEAVIDDYYNKYGKSFSGGGLEQYKKFEKGLKEFGSIAENDRAIPSDGSDVTDQNRSRASTYEVQSSGGSGEPMQGVEAPAATRSNGAWAPINLASPPTESEERLAYQSRQPYAAPFQQSPRQTSSTVPSLVSPSNGDTTPTVNSPYSNNNQMTQYHNSTQPQNAQAYPSMTQNTMAPPNPQSAGGPFALEQKYEGFISYNENISIGGTGFDNYAQEYPVDVWGNVIPMDVQPGAPVPYTFALGSVQNW